MFLLLPSYRLNLGYPLPKTITECICNKIIVTIFLLLRPENAIWFLINTEPQTLRKQEKKWGPF